MPSQVGRMICQAALAGGMDGKTHIRGLANGALRTAGQNEEHFGASRTFHIHFCHLDGYLAVTAKVTGTDATGSDTRQIEGGSESKVASSIARHRDSG